MENKGKLSISATDNSTEQRIAEENKNSFPAYPLYPVSDGIYNEKQNEEYLNAVNLAESKTHNDLSQKQSEKDFIAHKTGEDLDVTGTELDDEQEKIGVEDEEKIY